MEELERNLQTQFQLQKKSGQMKKNDKQKSKYKNYELNSP
jgi:hypothetical protein